MRLGLLAVALLSSANEARAADSLRVHEADSLFLDMSKLNLGTISSEDDKKNTSTPFSSRRRVTRERCAASMRTPSTV